MAHATLSNPCETLAAPLARSRRSAGRPAATAVRLWRQWRRARADKAALAAMDAHTRRDVGISDRDIAIARQRPWWTWPLT